MKYRGEIVWDEIFEGESDSHFYHAEGDEVDGLFNILMSYAEGDNCQITQVMITKQPK